MSDLVEKKAKHAKKTYHHAVGRRREAVARVRLYQGKTMWNDTEVKPGEVLVNQKLFQDYFKSITANQAYQEIFKAINGASKFSFTVKVAGGGKVGQLEAVLHGMARALAEFDPEKHRVALKKKGYLTRDPRTRQRRKVGMGGKSRRKRQSPKR